jgi:hypothetical protein
MDVAWPAASHDRELVWFRRGDGAVAISVSTLPPVVGAGNLGFDLEPID